MKLGRGSWPGNSGKGAGEMGCSRTREGLQGSLNAHRCRQPEVCLINISQATALSLDGMKPGRRQGEKLEA